MIHAHPAYVVVGDEIMQLSIQPMVVVFFVLGLGLLYILGYLMLAPLKLVLKVLFHAVLGGGLLLLVNLFGTAWGLQLAINPVTALTAGFLGAPGVVLLCALPMVL